MTQNKLEALNSKFETNQKLEIRSSKPAYDLEERTLLFAKAVRVFVRSIHKDIANIEDSKQLVRSSGSIGANYIEANDSLSKKDFIMRAKISKKEAKESAYWLKLLVVPDSQEIERASLLREANELVNILGAIIRNSEEKAK